MRAVSYALSIKVTTDGFSITKYSTECRILLMLQCTRNIVVYSTVLQQTHY